MLSDWLPFLIYAIIAAVIPATMVMGSFLFATLRGQHLHRVVFGPDGHTVLFQEKLLTNRYGRLRDVFEIASGEFLVLTSNRDGRGVPAADDDRILLVTLR